MLILSCPSKLQLLEGILKKSLPRALMVYGALMNINRGNPLGFEVVVDSWPDFKAVLTRPRKEVASDDSDWHANVYAGFYHDLDAYRTLVLHRGGINWAQSCLIQGRQDGIREVSQEAVVIKQVQLTTLSYITYLHPDPNKIPEHRSSLDPGFTFSSLKSSHVDLLNDMWAYGGNEYSRRYLANMLRCFPTTCLLDTKGQPVSWVTMDAFGGMGHNYTLPPFRGRGYSTMVRKTLAIKIHADGFPVYGHVALDNVRMQKLQEREGHQKLSDLSHFCVHSAI